MPHVESASRRRTFLFDAALLVALVLVAFSPCLSNGWIWDDDAHVTHNPTLASPAGLRAIWTDRAATPQYYPLVHTTFWLESRVWESPFGFHLDNLLLHALGVVLLWRLLVRLDARAAWFAAALFAVHPVTVESVAWVTERKNVLSFALALAAAIAWWDWIEQGRRSRGLLAWVFYLGALASKTVVASLPAVLLLLVWWKRRRLNRTAWASSVAMLGVGAWVGWLTAVQERTHVGAEGAGWTLDAGERVIVAGRALVFYASKLIAPVRLSFNYPRWDIDTASLWQWMAPVVVATIFGVLFFKRDAFGRGPFVAVAIYAGVLFPALGFLNVYPHRYSFVADHFQHHAAPALLALSAAGLARLPGFRERWGKQAAGWVVLLVALAASTWSYCRVYRDAPTIWRHVLERHPDSALALNNLAKLEAARGNTDEAIRLFERVVTVDPGVAEASNNLGQLLLNRGELDRAAPLLERAAELAPTLPQPRANLGHLARLRGDVATAIAHYDRAQQLAGAAPSTEISAWLGMLLAREGRTERALVELERGLADPRLGERAAIAEIRIRVSDPDPRYRDRQRALELSERLLRRGSPLAPEARDAIEKGTALFSPPRE